MKVSGVPYEVNLPPKEENGMIFKNLEKHFSFSMDYDDGDSAVGDFPIRMHVTKEFSVDEATAWPNILAEFCDFMASCYGYDIREKIVLDTYFKDQRFRWLPDELPGQEEDKEDYSEELDEALKDIRAQQDY